MTQPLAIAMLPPHPPETLAKRPPKTIQFCGNLF